MDELKISNLMNIWSVNAEELTETDDSSGAFLIPA